MFLSTPWPQFLVILTGAASFGESGLQHNDMVMNSSNVNTTPEMNERLKEWSLNYFLWESATLLNKRDLKYFFECLHLNYLQLQQYILWPKIDVWARKLLFWPSVKPTKIRLLFNVSLPFFFILLSFLIVICFILTNKMV